MHVDTKCIKNERRTPLQVGLLYETTSTGKRNIEAEVAVCSQINTKHIKTVWAERTVVEC